MGFLTGSAIAGDAASTTSADVLMPAGRVGARLESVSLHDAARTNVSRRRDAREE
jgi:hypothetical protein